MNIVIVGAGRAGLSFADALGPRHDVRVLHHHDVVDATLDDADLVMLCVPDDALESVAAATTPSASRVVAHVAGSRDLRVLEGHPRRASLHPLATLPDRATGASRLRGGVFAVEGDELVLEVVASLGGRSLPVDPRHRVLYHATAASAANHLVALMAHVEALAVAAGLSLRDFADLAHQSLEDAVALGPVAALTGPASRGDEMTLAAHQRVLPDEERSLYAALSARARRVAREATSWST